MSGDQLYEVSATVPLTVRVRAVDRETALRAAMARFKVAVSNGASGFPEDLTVRTVEPVDLVEEPADV